MTPQQRIKLIILIEKICKQKSYSEILGIEDRSRFKGEFIYKEEEEEVC